jgi:hypothetical protein
MILLDAFSALRSATAQAVEVVTSRARARMIRPERALANRKRPLDVRFGASQIPHGTEPKLLTQMATLG